MPIRLLVNPFTPGRSPAPSAAVCRLLDGHLHRYRPMRSWRRLSLFLARWRGAHRMPTSLATQTTLRPATRRWNKRRPRHSDREASGVSRSSLVNHVPPSEECAMMTRLAVGSEGRQAQLCSNPNAALATAVPDNPRFSSCSGVRSATTC